MDIRLYGQESSESSNDPPRIQGIEREDRFILSPLSYLEAGNYRLRKREGKSERCVKVPVEAEAAGTTSTASTQVKRYRREKEDEERKNRSPTVHLVAIATQRYSG